MILLLEGSQEGLMPKLWARLYGGDPAWNIQTDVILRLLKIGDCDEMWELWEMVMDQADCLIGETIYKMVIDKDGNLCLAK